MMTIADLLKTEHIDVDRNQHSGKPCLKNTRFPVSQLLAQLLAISEDKITEVCDDFSLNKEIAVGALNDMTKFYGQYWAQDERTIESKN